MCVPIPTQDQVWQSERFSLLFPWAVRAGQRGKVSPFLLCVLLYYLVCGRDYKNNFVTKILRYLNIICLSLVGEEFSN